MEKVYRIISNFLIKTDDIESLSNKACEELSTGDLVGEIDGKKTTSYRVAFKDDTLGKMSLVHVSSSETKEVVYEKGESGWAYKETKEGETISQETLADIEKFLGGEMPNNDVLALIQENGVVFDVRYYFVDDKIKIGSVPDDYTGSAFRFDKNGKIVIQSFNNGLITKYVEIGYNDLFINGITFSQKATVWDTDTSYDDLGSFLNDNISKLKKGDIIVDNIGTYCTVLMNENNQEVVFYFVDFFKERLVNVNYTLEDDEWVESEQYTSIGGTKLYKHTLEVIDDDSDPVEAITYNINFISNRSTAYNSILSLFNDLMYFGWGKFDNADEIFIVNINAITPTFISTLGVDKIEYVFSVNNGVISSDTVTPL